MAWVAAAFVAKSATAFLTNSFRQKGQKLKTKPFFECLPDFRTTRFRDISFVFILTKVWNLRPWYRVPLPPISKTSSSA